MSCDVFVDVMIGMDGGGPRSRPARSLFDRGKGAMKSHIDPVTPQMRNAFDDIGGRAMFDAEHDDKRERAVYGKVPLRSENGSRSASRLLHSCSTRRELPLGRAALCPPSSSHTYRCA